MSNNVILFTFTFDAFVYLVSQFQYCSVDLTRNACKAHKKGNRKKKKKETDRGQN